MVHARDIRPGSERAHQCTPGPTGVQESRPARRNESGPAVHQPGARYAAAEYRSAAEKDADPVLPLLAGPGRCRRKMVRRRPVPTSGFRDQGL
ncbi:DUF6214 family protein [Pseudomonas alkylphenolica]